MKLGPYNFETSTGEFSEVGPPRWELQLGSSVKLGPSKLETSIGEFGEVGSLQT